eukprot:UC4_evm1s988
MRLFPFDQQKLPITLYCSQDDIFKLHVYSVQYRNTTFNIPGWRLSRPQVVQRTGGPRSDVFVIVKRRYEHYVRSLMAYLLVINISSLSVHAIPTEDVADRLSVLFTLLLTVIAFRYTMEGDIPKLSYATTMDWFLNVNALSIVFSVIIVSAGTVGDLSDFSMFIGSLVIVIASFVAWIAIFVLSKSTAEGHNSSFDPASLEDLMRGTAGYLFGTQPYFLTHNTFKENT